MRKKQADPGRFSGEGRVFSHHELFQILFFLSFEQVLTCYVLEDTVWEIKICGEELEWSVLVIKYLAENINREWYIIFMVNVKHA